MCQRLSFTKKFGSPNGNHKIQLEAALKAAESAGGGHNQQAAMEGCKKAIEDAIASRYNDRHLDPDYPEGVV